MTGEIEKVIEELQAGSQDAITVMQNSISKADISVGLASKAGERDLLVTQSFRERSRPEPLRRFS